jgi:hypothetical protein
MRLEPFVERQARYATNPVDRRGLRSSRLKRSPLHIFFASVLYILATKRAEKVHFRVGCSLLYGISSRSSSLRAERGLGGAWRYVRWAAPCSGLAKCFTGPATHCAHTVPRPDLIIVWAGEHFAAGVTQ